ncbi:MAG: hypothetical protein ABWZ80_09310 [Beijerinckiaceae bacterium]
MTQVTRSDGVASNGRLPHLSGPAAAVRQVLAAHFLQGCRHILEIGGAGLPITGFVRHAPETVTVIDPKIEAFEDQELDGRLCRVRHIPRKFQAAQFDSNLPSLGVALLGLSLKPLGGRGAVNDELIGVLRRATVAVIDYSLNLPRAVGQAPVLIEATGLRRVVSIDLDMRDGALEAAGHGRRRFLVLAPPASDMS